MGYAGKYRSTGFTPVDTAQTLVRESAPRASARVGQSVNTPGHSTAPVERRYTGSAILGIATMHKSNAVPVFTKEDACDLATMRRN